MTENNDFNNIENDSNNSRNEKRFELKYINEPHISANLYDNKTFIGSIGIGGELIVELLNNLSDENEQLKKDRFICLDCEHSGYTEIGCLCEYNDHWQEHITECEDFKELEE